MQALSDQMYEPPCASAWYCQPTASSGLNNFQSMPVLPGASAPVAITGAPKKRSGGKGRGRGNSGGKGGRQDDDAAPRPVSKKDDELYQIDLMRRQVLLANATES